MTLLAADGDRRNGAQRRRVGGRRITDLADPKSPHYARVSAVAAYFSVDVRTVEKWHEAGFLLIRDFPYARRIALADVRRFRDTYHPSVQKPAKDA